MCIMDSQNKIIHFISRMFARYYFNRDDYADAIASLLTRIGWAGIFREALAHAYFLLGTEKSVALPRLVRFEVTNLCNLKCPMCPQPHKMKRPKRNMEFNLYKRIIDKNPGIMEVELFNWGEPLVHPEIDKFVKYASNRKIRTRFVTNAVLLSTRMSNRLFDSELSEIFFSVDNIGEEYEKIRNYSFDKIIDNILNFLSMAKERNYRIRTGINIIKSPFNEGNIEKAVNMLSKIGIDSISVEQCQFHDLIWQRTSRCFEPYRNMVVLSNGEVVPCCVDYDGVLSVGLVYEETDLKKIFNNEDFRKLRRSFRKVGDMNEICMKCHYRTITVSSFS